MRFLSKRGVLFLFVPGVCLVMGVVATSAMEQEEEEGRLVEHQSVQSAVITMMVDNGLQQLPYPVTEPTADMAAFPDASTSPLAKGLTLLDKPGYVLYSHDIAADENPVSDIHYISAPKTDWTYSVTSSGMVSQGPHR